LNNKQAPNWGELQHRCIVERAAHLSVMAWFDKAIIACFESPRINEETDEYQYRKDDTLDDLCAALEHKCMYKQERSWSTLLPSK
jgi:hypothetical protein